MLEKVFEIVRQNGPVLPVEVAKKLKIDSFVAHAFLMQLVEAGKVKASKEQVGNSFLYFIPGKESAAQLRANVLLQQSKKTAKTYQKEAVSVSPGVAEKREAFAQRLKEIEEREEKEKRSRVDVERVKAQIQKEDFIERFKQAITPFLTSKEEEEEPETQIERSSVGPRRTPNRSKASMGPIRTKFESGSSAREIEVKHEIEVKPKEIVEVKPESKKEEKKIKSKKKKKTIFGPKIDIVELAVEYLTERGAEIISKEVKKKKEVDFIVQIPSGIGPVKMFVKVKDKKSINEADLSLTYTQGQSKKLPILFLTTGRLTKTAQNYLKVIGGLLKVKFLETGDK